MDDHESSRLRDWLPGLNTWLALLAIIVSLISLYWAELRLGSLEVHLPEEVGIMLNDDGTVDLLVSVLFHNSGAPARNRIVRVITASLTDQNNQTLSFRWRDTWRFIGRVEFESLYPNFRARQTTPEDYILYEDRNIPFVVAGQASESRLLHLTPDPAARSSLDSETGTFDMILVVETLDGTITTAGRYAAQSGLFAGQYSWFQKAEGGP